MPLISGNESLAKQTAASPNILEVDPYPGSLSPVTFPNALDPSSKVA